MPVAAAVRIEPPPSWPVHVKQWTRWLLSTVADVQEAERVMSPADRVAAVAANGAAGREADELRGTAARPLGHVQQSTLELLGRRDLTPRQRTLAVAARHDAAWDALQKGPMRLRQVEAWPTMVVPSDA